MSKTGRTQTKLWDRWQRELHNSEMFFTENLRRNTAMSFHYFLMAIGRKEHFSLHLCFTALQTSTGSIHPCPLCHTAGCCSTVWWSRAFLHVQHAVIVLIWQFKFSEEKKKDSIWKLTGFEWQVLIFLVWNNLLFQNTEKQEGGVVKRPNWRETCQLTQDFFSSLWKGISPFNKGKEKDSEFMPRTKIPTLWGMTSAMQDISQELQVGREGLFLWCTYLPFAFHVASIQSWRGFALGSHWGDLVASLSPPTGAACIAAVSSS